MFIPQFLGLLLAALLGFAHVTAATPPACLLGVVGTQENPNDAETICKNESIASDIASSCGSQKTAAMSAYASVCKEAGVTIAASVTSASASGAASATASGNSSRSSAASSSSDAAESTTTPNSSISVKTHSLSLITIGVCLFSVGTLCLL